MVDQLKRILRLREVMARTGMSKSWHYAEKNNPDSSFPKPVRLPGRFTIGWVASEVDAWVDERIAERDEAVSEAA